MSERTLRGKVAIAGIGETTYYKHGQSPDAEFKLALKAVLAACRDDPKLVDGSASYGNDRSEAVRLAAVLGIRELCFSDMPCCGGVAASVANAPAAMHSGVGNCVIAFRLLAQGQFARYERGRANNQVPDAKVVAVLGGPMVTPVSSLVLGAEATL